MIKMDYGDAKHRAFLIQEYQKICSKVSRMQTRWTALRKKLVKKNAGFDALLPYKVEDFVVLEYEALVDIYVLFLSLRLAKADTIIDDAKSLFAYAKHEDRFHKKWAAIQPQIADFFMDKSHGFEIHTCHYCDMAYVNAYKVKGKKKKAQFDLDHVLDKGKCPILGLSLFNFVPSCQVCNSRIKSKKQLYKDIGLMKKLSPSSRLYDFENKVTIEVRPKDDVCSTIGFEKRMDDYVIRFNTHLDRDYDKEVEAFYLEDRYSYHKCEALRLLDLKERYTDARILELARMIVGDSKVKASPHGVKYITKLKQDIFAKEFNHRFHRSFGKLHDDIMK